MSSILDVEIQSSAEAVRVRTPKAKARKIDRPRLTADDWAMTGMIGCCCLFAGAFVTYVLYPAMTTLAASSMTPWNQGL